MLRARVIGGLKLIDRGEADDKIIGVLEGDYVWDHVQGNLAARRPCWSSASSTTSAPTRWCRANLTRCVISGKYGFDHAKAVIEAATRGLPGEIRRRHAGAAAELRAWGSIPLHRSYPAPRA